MYEDYLAHYGILGMKWGIRRFQNRDGSLTPEGRKRLGISEKNPRHTPSNARKKAKTAASNLEKARQAKAAKKEFEENKQRALEKGNATEVLKYKGSLTNQELQAAFNRINLERQLSSIAASETKSTWDKVDSIVSKAGKLKTYADKGIEIYNLLAKINNSFADEGEQMKIIDGKSPAESKKESQKDKLIRTGTPDQLLKNLGNLSGKELDDAMKRINYEDKLKRMSEELKKKKDEEDKKKKKEDNSK